MSNNKENNNTVTPSDLKLLSLDFEKKLLVFQLEQEKAKNVARVDVAQSKFQQTIENLRSKLNEKEKIIAHLTVLSLQEQPDVPTVSTNDTANNNPPECNNVPDMRKIEDLEQQLASCKKDKEKVAVQLQMSTSEKHNILGQIFQITMEKQAEREKFLQSLEELQKQISLQKTESELFSKNNREEKKKNLKKIKDLEQKLQLSQTYQKNCNAEILQLKEELSQTQTNLNKEKSTLQFEQREYQVKLENLTINLNSKTTQVNDLENIISKLQRDLQYAENGRKFKNVCTEIQELGKNMELLFDQQFQEKEKKISELHRQLKEFKSCSICFDEMVSNGDHRSVSLPCGHIFGNKCLQLCLAQARHCPKCRKSVLDTRSLRIIYLN